MTTSTNARKNRDGFTLTEILVVIGIIMVLMMLFFPVARKVRYIAKDVQCQNCLRNWHQALSQFANDHRGVIMDESLWPRDETFECPYCHNPKKISTNFPSCPFCGRAFRDDQRKIPGGTGGRYGIIPAIQLGGSGGGFALAYRKYIPIDENTVKSYICPFVLENARVSGRCYLQGKYDACDTTEKWNPYEFNANGWRPVGSTRAAVYNNGVQAGVSAAWLGGCFSYDLGLGFRDADLRGKVSISADSIGYDMKGKLNVSGFSTSPTCTIFNRAPEFFKDPDETWLAWDHYCIQWMDSCGVGDHGHLHDPGYGNIPHRDEGTGAITGTWRKLGNCLHLNGRVDKQYVFSGLSYYPYNYDRFQN